MTGVYIGAGTALYGAYSASQMPDSGGGGDAAAAVWQAEQDARLMREQNAYNNPDRYSNLGSETRVMIPAIKAQPAVRARPAKYNRRGELIRPAREAKPAVKAVPARWETRTTLAPEMEATQDAAMKKQQAEMEKAAAQGEFVAPEQLQFDPEGYRKYGDAIYENAMSRVRPEQEFDQAAMHTRLRQQGLQPGTSAYDRAMKNLMTSHGDVRAQAALQARVAGQDAYLKDASQESMMRDTNYAEDRKAWEDPLNRAVAFGSANQGVQNTTLPGYGTASAGQPGIDMLALQQKQSESDAAAKAAKAQAYSQAIAGLGKAAGNYFAPKPDGTVKWNPTTQSYE